MTKMEMESVIPVQVNFSTESPSRSGTLKVSQRGDTVVFRQTLKRTEQWETAGMSTVLIPRAVLRSIADQYAIAAVGDKTTGQLEEEYKELLEQYNKLKQAVTEIINAL